MSDLVTLFEDVVFAEVRLFDLVDERLREVVGEPATTFMVLSVIGRIDHCRVQDLSRHTGLTVGGASKAADRMEREGYARRAAHPRDRRSSTLALTPAGRGLLRRARPQVEQVTAAAVRNAARLGPLLAGLRQDLAE